MELSTVLYQNSAIRALEKLAMEQQGLTAAELMERAGHAVWDLLVEKMPQARNITVFCGCGNNGGDGFIVARQAKLSGRNVRIILVGHVQQQSVIAKAAEQSCHQLGIPIISFSDEVALPETDVIVDALLGIGLSRPLENNVLAAVRMINQANKPVLAIDVPSGINSNTGQALPEAVCANWTLTFIGRKIGLTTGEAVNYVGELYCHDLGIDKAYLQTVDAVAQLIEPHWPQTLLPTRIRDSHKGLYGHVYTIGGNYGMPGAPKLAAMAAARVGAGLNTVFTRAAHVGAIVANFPEIMCAGVEPKHIRKLLRKPSIIIVGPGLGGDRWAGQCLKVALKQQVPLLIDADGLRWLAAHPHKRHDWILTPHPGEAALLLHTDVATVQQHRLAAVQALQAKYGGIVVLKGAGSLIADGENLPAVCTQVGNPGMASGGMGDCLSGVIAGLVAQGLSLVDAAKAGVWLHAKAGDLAAAALGERGLVASDLLPFLQKLVNPMPATHKVIT
jgi:NAD(P)H-hydrate epimerase